MALATNADGKILEPSAVVVASDVYGEAVAIDHCFFVATRPMRVTKIMVRPLVVGSDGGAVTAEIRKAGAGVAIASGTVLHTGTADLKGTINTTQTLTLSATAAALNLAAGDGLGMDVTGTMTAARGVVSVELVPI